MKQPTLVENRNRINPRYPRTLSDTDFDWISSTAALFHQSKLRYLRLCLASQYHSHLDYHRHYSLFFKGPTKSLRLEQNHG